MPSYLYDQWWSWMISGVARLLSMGQKHVSLASWSSYSSFTQPQHACLASPPGSTFPEHSQDTCSKTVNLCQLLQKCFSQHWQFGASTHAYTANEIQAEQNRKKAEYTHSWSLGCRLAVQLHQWRSVGCFVPCTNHQIFSPLMLPHFGNLWSCASSSTSKAFPIIWPYPSLKSNLGVTTNIQRITTSFTFNSLKFCIYII